MSALLFYSADQQPDKNGFLASINQMSLSGVSAAQVQERMSKHFPQLTRNYLAKIGRCKQTKEKWSAGAPEVFCIHDRLWTAIFMTSKNIIDKLSEQ